MGSPASRVGTSFGPYQLESLIGKGGMGEVYRAHDTVRDRTVALKLLPPHLAEDPVFQERFRRECQTVARLDEPHVIPIHDFGEIDGQLFLDMRLVNGRDLRGIMGERGVLAPAEALPLVQQVAAALDAAHAAGLVHRDVKPENILVTDADFAYLVDFGVAHADSDSHLTKTGTAVGSIAYMAPEQFDGNAITGSVDVYALAAVFFELITGRKPYPGDSISTITKGLLFDPIPVASTLNSAISPALDQVLAWGLAKNPDERCPSAQELTQAAIRAIDGRVSAPQMTQRFEGPNAKTRYLSPGDTRSDLGVDYGATVSNPAISNPGLASPAAGYGGVAGRAVESPGFNHTPVAGTAYRPQLGMGASQPGFPTGSDYLVVPARAPRSGANKGLFVLAAVLLAALAGLGAWLLADKLGETKTSIQAGTTTVVAQENVTTTMTTSIEAAPTATWTPGPPPADNQPCPGYSGLGTGYPQWTGCEFAANVRTAYIAGGPMGEIRTVDGWAPHQGRNYVMHCAPYLGIIACRGGNQAVVYIY